ncbi:MAG: hypothetical protein ACPG8W_14440, partial [Candidatus Promineifilaceae bacterium]
MNWGDRRSATKHAARAAPPNRGAGRTTGNHLAVPQRPADAAVGDRLSVIRYPLSVIRYPLS